MNTTQIEALAVGDTVGVANRHDAGATLLKVTKRTATQVVLSDGSRWNKRGTEIGDGSKWYRRYLMTSKEAEERISDYAETREHASLASRLEKFRFRDLDIDTLKKLCKILEEAK